MYVNFQYITDATNNTVHMHCNGFLIEWNKTMQKKSFQYIEQPTILKLEFTNTVSGWL